VKTWGGKAFCFLFCVFQYSIFQVIRKQTSTHIPLNFSNLVVSIATGQLRIVIAVAKYRKYTPLAKQPPPPPSLTDPNTVSNIRDSEYKPHYGMGLCLDRKTSQPFMF
jgi:hypothetical protein